MNRAYWLAFHGQAMQSPSSSRRQSRRGGDWTFATDNNTGEVLWYCPPGGDDKFGNRVQLQAYFSKRGKPYPRELFTFRGGDVPPSWIRVEAEGDDHGEEEQDSGGAGAGAGAVDAGAGWSERTCSSPPVAGKVRGVAVPNRFGANKPCCCAVLFKNVLHTVNGQYGVSRRVFVVTLSVHVLRTSYTRMYVAFDTSLGSVRCSRQRCCTAAREDLLRIPPCCDFFFVFVETTSPV